jgi:hypothetical protein
MREKHTGLLDRVVGGGIRNELEQSDRKPGRLRALET